MKIYSREQWHARTPRAMAHQGNPTEAFLHHSADAEGSSFDTLAEQIRHMQEVQRFHMDDRGWSDIGYHFVVFQQGDPDDHEHAVAFAARPVLAVPAAQEGHNTGTLAICVVGNGDKEEIHRNTRFVIETLIQRHPSVKVLGGHRDVTETDCPGGGFYKSIPRIAQAAGVRVYRH